MVKKAIILVLAMMFCMNLAYAQNMIDLGGGISKITGDDSEYFNMGFNGYGQLFKKYSETMYIGGRVAYNHWSINEDEFMGGYAGMGAEVSGSVSVIELLPSIRIMPASKGGSSQFFFQAGVGLYMLKSEYDFTMSFYGYEMSESSSDSENKMGINLGAGIILNNKFSITPMYNIVFTEDESLKYFVVDVGILLGN
ncbi:hypothetical protein JW948_12010 [bacterium]|nr:hypothetical protein [bacterium]